jgi:hypothetical protein
MRSISPGLKLLGFAGVAVMSWSAYAHHGPYQWALDWQSAHLGSGSGVLAFLGPLALMWFVLFLWHRRNVMRQDPDKLRAFSQTQRRQSRWIAKLGLAALVVAAGSIGLGVLQRQIPPTVGEINLLAGEAGPPSTDLARVTGIAMTRMIVVFDENPKGNGDKWTYVPLMSVPLKLDRPIRYFLRTRQTEWTAKDGGPDATKQLRRDAAPFVMTTEPAQLRSYGFPKEIQANFEQAGFKIDDRVTVIQQSADKDLTPYWAVALLSVIVAFTSGRVWAKTRSMAARADRRAMQLTRTT